MSIFSKRHIPKSTDLCVCRHTYNAHDAATRGCLRRCPCTNYVKLTYANRKTVVMGEETDE